MNAPYRDLAHLVLHALKDRDYRLVLVDRSAAITVAAIHGGAIEPLTGELATAIAGQEHNLYAFCGIRDGDNQALRIAPHRFDDVRLQALMRRSQAGLAILGAAGADPDAQLGGRNRALKRLLELALREAGFAVRAPAGPRAAHDPALFYNWPAAGGVQLALPPSLRASLVDGPFDTAWADASRYNARFGALVEAVRAALARYQAEIRSDLDAALARFEETTRRFPRALRDPEHRHE